MKLRVKISLLMGIVVLASTVALLVAVGFKVSSVMEKSCLNFLGSEADTDAKFLKSMVDGQLDILGEVAGRARTRTMDPNTVPVTLRPDVARLNALDLAMVTPEGDSYPVRGNPINIKDHSYFKRAISGERNIEMIVIDGKLVAIFAVPIRKNDETNAPVIGVLLAHKDGASAISNLVTEVKSLYKSGFPFLIDEKGTIIAHRNKDLVNRQFNPIKEADRDPSLKPLANIVVAALQNKHGGSEYYYEGKKLIGLYSQIPSYPWIIFLNTEKQEVEEALSQIIIVMILTGFICFVITVIIAIIVGKSIAKPLVHMVDALKNITHGEGDLTQTIPVQSKDETGDLAGYFNKLMDVLRHPISEAKSIVNHLVSVSEDLSSVSAVLANGSEETLHQSKAATNTTEQLSANINAMTTGAEAASMNANEVAGAAEQMSTNMNTIASAVEEMSSSIAQISGNAGEARKVSVEATNKASNATSVMGELSSAAKEIGHVTEVIKKIADKTNLLALNATIEAASAGEAGKGFAVVAGEIKELANQSAESADDIARRIESIQSGTDKAVNVIHDVSDIIVKINQSVESISGHVSQQTKASNEIANNVAQANTGAKRVAGAIGEVAKGANAVSKNAGEAAKGAQNVSSNVVGMNRAATESSQEVSRVKQSADRLSKMAGQLHTAMDKFKV